MRTDLSIESRVWLYQSERELSEKEIEFLKSSLKDFCISWTAHDKALKADCEILHGRFILLTVDETQTDASGCSIDKSVRKLKELSNEMNLDFFNRMELAYLEGENVKTLPISQIKDALNEGKISEDTLFFNTLVKDLRELRENFKQPLKEHWIKKTL